MYNYKLSLMVSRLRIMALLLCLCPIILLGQENPESGEPDLLLEEEEKISDAWTAPFITDEMTIDDEQNKSWRMGDYKYSSKPRNSWEFGLHFGHFFIDGDVDREIPGGWGVGLHLRRALNYVISIRSSFFYGMATGIEKQPYFHRNVENLNGVGGGLVENVFDQYNPNTGGPGAWFPSHRTRFISADLSAIINIGNILFHKERNKWNLYLGIGAGISTHDARLDLLGADNNPYADVINEVGWTRDKFNTSTGRSEIEAALRNLYDGTYETEGFKKEGIFRLGDDLNVHFVFIPMIGISRKINKRINIGLEHQVFVADNDYLDGIRYRSSVDLTSSSDIGHYTNIRIGINLGNFNKVTEPLYWLNPLDQAFNDLSIAKNNTQLDLVDEDNDGVIDIIDQELDTPEDCPVDTRGILLDSDGDGIADCEDREPYSRPGCQIDEFGIAQCDDGYIKEEDVNEMIDSRLEEFKTSYASVLTLGGVASDSYTGPTTIKEGQAADGSTYVVTMPTDNAGNIVATDRATKVVTRSDGSTYDVVLPVDNQGNFVATDDAIRTGIQPNGDKYVLTSPVDSNGNFVASEKANKVVTASDGSKYVVTLPVDTDGDFVATDNATKTVVNPDGSGYVVTLPVDTDGNFVATDEATKTVVNKDGSGYVLTLPVDSDGNFVATNDATKTVRKSDGTISKFKVPVNENGEIPSSSNTVVESGTLPPAVKTTIKNYMSRISKTTTPNSNNNGGYANSGNYNGTNNPNNSGSNSSNNSSNRPSGNYTGGNVVTSGCGDWFLPMIHYDLNKSQIKPEYYSHLHNVAQVMKKCPEVCVVAQGHTDTRSTNDYNRALSYMRAKAAVDYLTDTYKIDRSRIKLMYGGEENPMVISPRSEAHHFMNRRVEFRTCEANDFDMVAPEGANKVIQSGAAKPDFYQGNKTSGY